MNLIKKPLLLITVVGLLAWLPTLNFWFFKGYEATWLLGVGEYSVPNLLKSHAFLYYLDWKIFGWNPWGWYLTSLVLHLLASILLFKFVFLLSKSKTLSLIAALFFVASTAYNDVLTWGSFNSYYPMLLIWMLSALISFFRYKTTNKKIYLFASILFSFLGLFTRETGLVVIPAITLLDIIFSKKIFTRKTLTPILKRQIPFYIVLIAFFMIRSIYGGTPGDSADSNVKLQMRFVEDGLYLEYAKASILTMGKLIPPQIIPYPILNLVREFFSRFIYIELLNTYFFPVVGWIILGSLGGIFFLWRKSAHARVFIFFLLWIGLLSLFVSLAVPNTPEVLARAYEYNTMRYRYFAFAGTSVVIALVLTEILKHKKNLLVLVTFAAVIINLLMIWRIEQKVYALSYKPAKEFNLKFNQFFPTLPKESVFYLYPHASGLSDYLLEWYLIKENTYPNLIGQPYRIESQIIAVLSKIKKGEVELSNVFFLDHSLGGGLLNNTERVRKLLLNQETYRKNLEKEEDKYRTKVFDGPVVDIPYDIEFDLQINEKEAQIGEAPDSQKFRALVDYLVARNHYLRTVSLSTAYTMSQREGEPFHHVLPENLLDGNRGFRYAWVADTFEPWVQADLGEERSIAAVAWGSLAGSTRVPATYSILVSKDGKEWVRAKDVKNAKYSRSIDVFDTPQVARFIRMEVHTTSGGDFLLLDEFDVIPTSSQAILSLYKDRDSLLNDAYNLFSFTSSGDDLAYLKSRGLDEYWGKIIWETNNTSSIDGNQIMYFPYSITNSSQRILRPLKDGEIYSGSDKFLNKTVTLIGIEFGKIPFDTLIPSVQLSPRFKL